MSQRKSYVKEEKYRFCDKGVEEKDLGIQCELCSIY